MSGKTSCPSGVVYTVTFLNTRPEITTLTAANSVSIVMGSRGIVPAATSRIASMAKLSGFTWAMTLSQPGITSYGIRALEVKNSGIVTIAVKAAKES